MPHRACAVGRRCLQAKLTVMASTDSSGDFGNVVARETPFSLALFPPIRPLTYAEPGVELTVIVASAGIGNHPAYIVRFESAPLILIYAEHNAPYDLAFVAAKSPLLQACSLKWVNSPLVRRNARIGSLANMSPDEPPMQHFIIAGAECVVEALSTREPVITEQWAPFTVGEPYAG